MRSSTAKAERIMTRVRGVVCDMKRGYVEVRACRNGVDGTECDGRARAAAVQREHRFGGMDCVCLDYGPQ